MRTLMGMFVGVMLALTGSATALAIEESTRIYTRTIEHSPSSVTYPLSPSGPAIQVERRTIIKPDEDVVERRIERRTIEEPAVVERRVVEESDVREESRGFLSSTVHFVGEILALPFRLVGGVLRWLF